MPAYAHASGIAIRKPGKKRTARMSFEACRCILFWMAARRRASPLNLFSHALARPEPDVVPKLISGPSANGAGDEDGEGIQALPTKP